jgi:acetyl-CoA synthetase
VNTTVQKHASSLVPAPHLLDHTATAAQFSWEQARHWLDGLPGGAGLNIAHEAVDRHLLHGRGDKVAIRWIGKSGERQEFTYAELARASNQFANALEGLGVRPGERVFVLMGRLPELYVAVLGALKARCVVTPLFSAFGPEPIVTRAEMGDARVLVTTPELYQRKIRDVRERLPRPQTCDRGRGGAV